MTRSLKINWILPKPNLSGGVKSNRLIAEAMVRRGHDVTITYPTMAEDRRFALGYRLRKTRDAIVKRVLGSNAPHAPTGRHHLERSTARLRPIEAPVITAADVPDADVTIATWWRTREWIEGWHATKGAKAYFIRHYEIHGGDKERVRATYRLPGQKLVIARWLQRLMAEEFGDPNAVLVPNGVDRGQFKADPRGKNPSPVVGTLYGIQEWKGAPTVFEAFGILQKRWPELRVVSFGSNKIVRHHEPPANLEFHLRPAQNLIPKLYASTDCWVVPSVSEGFGMPGIEAAACRCPLVVTRCGGPEDFVEEGWNGFLVPPSDPEAMADRVARVLGLDQSAWARMSQSSYEMSLRFDWDKSAEVLERTLFRLVDGHCPAITGGAA